MATKHVLIPYDELKRLVIYSPLTGLFIAKVSRDRARAGDVLGTKSAGYFCFRINRRLYRTNRLAWYYMTGEWPGDLQVDHINGCRADDRWENLRLVTNSQNAMNAKVRRNNSSGFKGVTWNRDVKKWQSYIRIDGKAQHLGLFDDLQEAVAARQQAEIELFGEFSTLLCRT